MPNRNVHEVMGHIGREPELILTSTGERMCFFSIAKGTAEERALVAWGYVLMAIAKYGRYQNIKFDDPAIHYAITCMGGWHILCQALTDELPFMKKDFTKHYIRGERVANWSNVPEYFVGEHEIRNTRGDHSEAAPEFVLVQTRGSQKALDAGPSITSKTSIN